MIQDRDAYFKANQLVSQFGSKAMEHALIQFGRVLDRNDAKAGYTWSKIIIAINNINKNNPRKLH
ncbi:hypothetical protein [Paremcibacter congregatus]|uniref:hypothetical protein n=1 Tax=Paremcibacter congregatus TaxID=2043170 RepID=UPI003A8D1FD8